MKKSGQSNENYLKENIFSQLGICDMHLGNNLLSNKMMREVEYVGNGHTTFSCYNTAEEVPRNTEDLIQKLWMHTAVACFIEGFSCFISSS